MDWETFTTVWLNWLGAHWPSVSLFLLTTCVVGGAMILYVRWRKRWLLLPRQMDVEEEELEDLGAISERDIEALEVVKRFRAETWKLPENQLNLNIDFLLQRAMDMARAVARVYHPETDHPEYEVSLRESILMVRRVVDRLYRLSRFGPFRILSHRKLRQYQKFYRMVRQINDSSIIRALKRYPRLSRLARWAWTVKQSGNPLYWARRDLTREGYFQLIRWFHATFISQVGREAIRLYSDRSFNLKEEQDATVLVYRLFRLCGQWQGPGAAEWSALVGFVGDLPFLDHEAKCKVLTRCAAERIPGKTRTMVIETRSGRKWYRKGLRLLAATPPETDLKRRLLNEEENRLEPEADPS